MKPGVVLSPTKIDGGGYFSGCSSSSSSEEDPSATISNESKKKQNKGEIIFFFIIISLKKEKVFYAIQLNSIHAAVSWYYSLKNPTRHIFTLYNINPF